MDERGVETVLGHQRHGPVRGASTLAADAEDGDVVAHEARDIHRDRVVRKGGKADLAAARTAPILGDFKT